MNDYRKHLTSREVEKLIAATKGTRNEVRDRCLLLLIFRHGLRVSEALSMNLSQVDLEGRTRHVTRLKSGLSTTTRCGVTNCASFAHGWPCVRRCIRKPRHFLSVSGAAHCHARRRGWRSAVMVKQQSLKLPPTPTCCVMHADSPSPIKVPTHD